MTDKNKQFSDLEPYRIALKLEREGRQFFIDASKSTTSDLARKTFRFLAEEEGRHIRKIEEFKASLDKSQGGDLLDVGESDADAKFEQFISLLEEVKDEFRPTESDVEAYRMALRFENGAEDFYQEMFDKADNPLVKKFYRWLIVEESMHSRVINSCLKFLENPSEWFRRRKSES